MTNWTMHTKYEEFEKLGNIVRILLAQDTLPTSENEAVQSKHKYVIREMWGAIYHKNDYTIKHWHWPCTWSFGYYLKTSETTPPIVFHNAIQGSSVGNISYNPKTGDLIIFPSWLKHGSNQDQNFYKNLNQLSFDCHRQSPNQFVWLKHPILRS